MDPKKIIGGLLLGAVILWLIGTMASNLHRSQAAESAPPPPADKWQTSESRSQMDDSKTVLLALDSDDEIHGPLGAVRPSLMVRCKEKQTAVYVVTGMAASVEEDIEGGPRDYHTVSTVCDEQRGYMPRIEIAGFFLATFLGCRLLEDPRVTTKRFFMAAQDFFNERMQDPAERTEALNHLLSEITNHRARINVREFARDFLPASQRQAFMDHLKGVGITSETIRKDISLIESQTKKMALEFESGVAVVGNRDAFAEHVTVTQSRNGAARVVVTDKLKRVKGK